jgi:DNA polymerase-3 subunit gamma/tau
MLSTQAFNGLLKTLEEPPEHVKFIFATTEIRKVPVTVLSRCQRFDLRRIEADRAGRRISRRIAARPRRSRSTPDALALIARAAEGSARDGCRCSTRPSPMAVAADEPPPAEEYPVDDDIPESEY